MPEVYLLHPYEVPVRQVLIRRPDFGNGFRLATQVSNRHARNGSRRTYKRTPTYRTVTMRFSELTRLKAIELQEFLDLSAGEDIRMVDWEGLEWRGVITTNEPQFTTDHRGRLTEAGSVTLEFEGSPIAVEA